MNTFCHSQCADMIGVPLLDHVIVTRDRSKHSSLLEKAVIR